MQRHLFNNERVNYVDDNNRFVGFSIEQQCCEKAEHYVEDSEGKRIDLDSNNNSHDFASYSFANEKPKVKKATSKDDIEDLTTIRFRLVSKNKENLYLVLSNRHNGFYTHHWESNRGSGEI